MNRVLQWPLTVHSPFQKLKFVNNSQKVRKGRYPSFLVLSNLIGFAYFAPNI